MKSRGKETGLREGGGGGGERNWDKNRGLERKDDERKKWALGEGGDEGKENKAIKEGRRKEARKEERSVK